MRIPRNLGGRAVCLAALVAAGILLLAPFGCIRSEGNGSRRTSGSGDAARQPGAGAVQSDTAASPPPESRDLKQYPPPEVLPGADLVVGPAEILPQIRRPDVGGSCPLEVSVSGDTATLTVQSIAINCCTKSVAPSVSVRGDTAEIHLWEYMTEICECFHHRAVRFSLAPFDTTGLCYRLHLNDRARPCWEGKTAAPD